jgi:hypothetical protein
VVVRTVAGHVLRAAVPAVAARQTLTSDATAAPSSICEAMSTALLAATTSDTSTASLRAPKWTTNAIAASAAKMFSSSTPTQSGT